MVKKVQILRFFKWSLIVLFISAILQVDLYAQREIDSLIILLEKSSNDTSKIILLNTLSDKQYRNSPSKALVYSQEALKLSQELGYKRGMAKSYNNIGIVYYCQGNYTNALNNYLEAVKVYEEINDKQGLQKTYNNIGVFFFDQQNYDKAEEYYMASLKIKQELGDAIGIAKSYNNLGIIAQNKKNYENALAYYEKALAITEEMNNKEVLAQTLNNMGMVYLLTKEYNKALIQLTKALDIKKVLNDQRGISNTLNNIADAFYNMGQYSSAIETLTKSIQLAKELGAKDIYKIAYEKLSSVYAASGNYKEAYKYHKLYSEVKDSLFSEAQSKQAADLEAKYENEKKEKEIELLKRDNELQELKDNRKNILIVVISAGLVLVLIMAIVAYRENKEKQKVNQLLSVQNEEITRQKSLIEEKNKDIVDSIQYAKRIQEAIYPSKKLVRSYLEESFILFKPKDIISGDFYWMVTIGNKILFAAVDCTGHGVPGALMSIVGYNGLNQAVNEYKLTKPNEILNHLNKTVNYTLNKSRKEEITLQDGMDIALCCYDKENKKLEYAGAYNPLYLVRKGQLLEFKADRQAVGAFVENELKLFTNTEIPIEVGDIVYVFSDGYADQFGGDQGKKFTYKRLKDTLVSISSKTMDEQRHTLHLTFEHWKGTLEQVDDVCLIGIKLV